MSEPLHNYQRFFAEKKGLLAWLEDNEQVVSLLHDLDMLPEQVGTDPRDEGRMLLLLDWLRSRL